MKKFIRGLQNMKITIEQIGIDFCEQRMHRSKNIKGEIFWHKIGWWFLKR